MIQFVIEKPVDVATQEVRDRVAAIMGDLPRDIDQPQITKLDPDAAPVLFLSLRAKDRTPKEITDLADRVVRRSIESTSGVGQVRIIGGQKRQVNVWVDPVKLRALGLSANVVASAIDSQNLTLPGGRVDVSRDFLTLRVHGRVESVDELRAIVVQEQSGRAIRLGEIAEVEDGTEEFTSSALWNGERTVVLAIRKQSGTNTIEVVDKVLARVKAMQPELPAGYSLEVQRDGSAVIRTGTDAVTEHLLLGSLFAALIVLFFLGNVRSTIIAAVAIPMSIIGTFALMYLRDYTLNTITLLALALAVGIVIDDAIVVLENIFKKVEEEGVDPMVAAVEGTREIGPAVLATTLSLIAVFLPIAFIAGIPGRFLASFGFTMAFSIAVSLFVSFTLTPMLASRWLKAKAAGDHEKPALERLVDVFYRPIERGYARLLAFCMRHRWIVVRGLGALAPRHGPARQERARRAFCPSTTARSSRSWCACPRAAAWPPPSSSASAWRAQVRTIPRRSATLLTIGDDDQQTPNLARIYVKLVDPIKRKRTQDQIKDQVRKQILAKLPAELRTSVADVNEFGGGQSTARIQYILTGTGSRRAWRRRTTRILQRMRKIPGAVDVDSSLIVGKPELGVFIDRDRAADLGVQVGGHRARAAAARRWPEGVDLRRGRASSTTCGCAPPAEYRTDEDRCSSSPCPRASSAWCRSPTW